MNTPNEERLRHRERLYKQFRTQPENTINLVFKREPEPGRTFSQEAFEDIDDFFISFLAARADRWFYEHPREGMREMSVSVRIAFE